MKTYKYLWSHLAQFFVEWEMFQIKAAGKIKPHILCSIAFFFNRAVYEITWENTVQPDRPQTIWRMRFAYWTPNSTYTHGEYVILTTFPLQQGLHERPQCYVILFCPLIIRCYIISCWNLNYVTLYKLIDSFTYKPEWASIILAVTIFPTK